MKALVQNLIQEFTALIFEKDESEFQEMSELKSPLPILAYQESNSEVKIKLGDT